MPLTTTKLGLQKPDAASGDTRADLYNAIRNNADTLETLFGKYGYAEVLTTEVTATAATAADLATVGPSVTLVVPTNGLVAIRARADNAGAVNNLRVYLAQDGTSLGQILDVAPSTTGHTVPGSTAGTSSAHLGGWLVFNPAAGSRTFKLMYSHVSGVNTTTAANRKLWARVLAF